MVDDFLPTRVLPELTAENIAFWTSGADGELRVQRCGDCGNYDHPPYPRCTSCLSADVAPSAVSGRGTVYGVTVNRQQWLPGAPPYVVAIVELDEQPGLRVFTNVIDSAPSEVRIGDRVEVDFCRHEDVWIPQFRKVVQP